MEKPETSGGLVPNNVLQGTFDPPPIFAVAKTAVASNATEHRRSMAMQIPLR